MRHMKVLALTTIIIFAIAPSAFAKKKSPIPCQNVFVTGKQPYAVAWANENLAKITDDCIIPVATLDRAKSVLVLNCVPSLIGDPDYPGCPGGPGDQAKWNRETGTSDYFDVTCNEVGGYETCDDSNGNEYYSDCFVNRFGGISCSFGSGPSLVHVLQGALVAWATSLLKTSAWAYLSDKDTHKLLWSYEGSGAWDGGIRLDAECKRRIPELFMRGFCRSGKPMPLFQGTDNH